MAVDGEPVAVFTGGSILFGAIEPRRPGEPDLSQPEPVDPAVLQHRLEHGERVVDLRGRQAYAAGHVPGTVAIELADPFATYVGWTVPWGVPITLVGDAPDQVAEARRQLAASGSTSWPAPPWASWPTDAWSWSRSHPSSSSMSMPWAMYVL